MCEIVTEVCGIVTEVCGIVAEVCEIVTEVCEIVTEVCEIVTEVCEIVTEVCGIVTKVCGIVTKVGGGTKRLKRVCVCVLFWFYGRHAAPRPRHISHNVESIGVLMYILRYGSAMLMKISHVTVHTRQHKQRSHNITQSKSTIHTHSDSGPTAARLRLGGGSAAARQRLSGGSAAARRGYCGVCGGGESGSDVRAAEPLSRRAAEPLSYRAAEPPSR